MRQLTLQRLQVFCAVYEHGSISHAARHLGISQPTASRHIHDFEAALKVALFEKRRGQLSPTREADALYDESRMLSEGVTRLERHVEALSHGAASRLSVATISLFAREHLAYSAKRVLDAFPQLKFSATISLVEHQITLIRDGRVDLGFAIGPLDVQGVHVTQIGTGEMVLLAPEDSHPAATDRIGLDQIDKRLEMLCMSPRGAIGRQLHEALARHGIVPSEQILSHSLDALPHLARMRGAATIVDNFTAGMAPVPGMKTLRLRPKFAFSIKMISLAPLTPGTAHAHFAKSMERALQRIEV